jgi:SAM-dependent methyltransferase
VIGRVARRTIRYGLLRLPVPARQRVEIALLRAYESYTLLRSQRPDPFSADGLPIPPGRLRVLVSGTADPEYFLDTGRRQAALFERMLERNGRSLREPTVMLDFGCGCGRIARWWGDRDQLELHGCDPDEQLIRWTRENLPFLRSTLSAYDPPLPYADNTFDVVYALSVFTHQPEEHVTTWMAELRRILRPGGHLLFSVAGEGFRDRLREDDAARYRRGEEVVQFETARGTNLCIAYHSPAYVQARLLDGFALEEAFLTPQHPDESADALMPQDCYLVRLLEPVAP